MRLGATIILRIIQRESQKNRERKRVFFFCYTRNTTTCISEHKEAWIGRSWYQRPRIISRGHLIGFKGCSLKPFIVFLVFNLKIIVHAYLYSFCYIPGPNLPLQNCFSSNSFCFPHGLFHSLVTPQHLNQ